MKNRFILRQDSGEVWPAGSPLVQVSDTDIEESATVLVHHRDTVIPVVDVPRTWLLCLHKFLKNQPRDNYWCLRQRLAEGASPPLFLSNARSEHFGHVPFRFESLGELVYYLNERGMRSNQFEIGQFIWRPYLTTTKTIKKNHATT